MFQSFEVWLSEPERPSEQVPPRRFDGRFPRWWVDRLSLELSAAIPPNAAVSDERILSVSAFTIVYGLIYLLVFNAVVKRLPSSWAWWQMGLAGLSSVILIHALLEFLSHVSIKRRRRKAAKAQSMLTGEPSEEAGMPNGHESEKQ